MIDLVFWVALVLDALLAVVLYITPWVSSPQYRYGVHVPAAVRADPALAPADRTYRVGIGFATLASVPFLAVGASAPWSWVALLGPLAVIAIGFGGYLVARSEVLRVKSRGTWPSGGPRIAVAEIVPAQVDHTWPAWLLLPIAVWIAFLVWGIVLYPGLPAMIPTHFNGNGVADTYSAKTITTVFTGAYIGVAILLVLTALAAAITRARAPLDPARPRSDAARQFQFRFQGVRGLLVFGAFVQATIGLSSAQTWDAVSPSAFGGFLPIVPTFVGTAILLAIVLRLGQLGSRLPMPPGPELPMALEEEARRSVDDDADWVGGVMYHNRANSALLVPRRFGVGWTLNWGNPWSWVIIVALVAIPFILLIAARLQ